MTPSGNDHSHNLAQCTDKVLFDEIWERSQLSKRDRSLMTVNALVTLGAVEQLNFRIGFARDNGVTETEIVEAITHLAFYVGWPRAMAAVAVLRSAIDYGVNFFDTAEV